ncbi:hypothetical protein CR105_08810 [Massilia eurypsychrophila]|uniref:Uncharacterized protein n=1 Tax=Massilia eurypsychrophila TaxID=1485217 RepID=A0A2G8TGX8_9BURK|nr:hypothetical protein CR105_08810 [Massilia eurypsychrophila]
MASQRQPVSANAAAVAGVDPGAVEAMIELGGPAERQAEAQLEDAQHFAAAADPVRLHVKPAPDRQLAAKMGDPRDRLGFEARMHGRDLMQLAIALSAQAI